jgi:hypothetical protein
VAFGSESDFEKDIASNIYFYPFLYFYCWQDALREDDTIAFVSFIGEKCGKGHSWSGGKF